MDDRNTNMHDPHPPRHDQVPDDLREVGSQFADIREPLPTLSPVDSADSREESDFSLVGANRVPNQRVPWSLTQLKTTWTRNEPCPRPCKSSPTRFNFRGWRRADPRRRTKSLPDDRSL
jgi:hypothetical protein